MARPIVLMGGVGIALQFPKGAMAAHRDLVIESYDDPRAVFCLTVFGLSYLLMMAEEKTLLRKSKPVMLGAGIIWVVVGLAVPEYGVDREQLEEAIFHDLDEYGSLMLFLMAAMIYVSPLEGVNVFAALRSRLVGMGLSYRRLFWVTGVIAFFLSAVADNLTTALVMSAVVLALGADNPRFVAIAMFNIVCAANAGGAISPFGDITTLMVWQSGRNEFIEFFALFIPAVVTYTVPVVVMSLAVPTANVPPETALTPAETDLLDRLVPDKKTTLEGHRHLAHYMIKIARLGGYLARKHDAPPGNLVMWRGLSRLTDIKLGATLSKDAAPT